VVDCLIVPGTIEPIVIIHHTNAGHNTLPTRVVIDSYWQTEREVGIYGVIFHVDTDSGEVLLRSGIAVRTIICQCEGGSDKALAQPITCCAALC